MLYYEFFFFWNAFMVLDQKKREGEVNCFVEREKPVCDTLTKYPLLLDAEKHWWEYVVLCFFRKSPQLSFSVLEKLFWLLSHDMAYGDGIKEFRKSVVWLGMTKAQTCSNQSMSLVVYIQPWQIFRNFFCLDFVDTDDTIEYHNQKPPTLRLKGFNSRWRKESPLWL